MNACFAGIFLICSAVSCTAQQTEDFKIQKTGNSLLWQVSGNELKKPSFLFGTFHLLCKNDIQISGQLKDAIRVADNVYMELDMDDPSTLLGGMLYMNMIDGRNLRDLYTEEEYAKVRTFFEDTLHVPIMMFQKAKPYFLVALLYPRMLACKQMGSIEEELVKVAKQNNKEILGLETIQLQASIFDSIPYEWQAKELLKNIDSVAFYQEEFNEMLRMYKSQDMDSIESMVGKSEFGSEEYQELLINKRNRSWVHTLKKVMKTESVFVAVGTGHLTGENGLISLLRKEGYWVEPLVNK
ncbi:MAG: TraB/GumN family protein [Ginsengibacter sp.]